MSARNLALLVFGVFAVSISSPLIRLADAPPLAIAFYRNLFAALPLLAAAVILRRPELRSLARRDVGALVLSGVLLAVHFATWIPSVTLTTVAASTVLVTTQPVWAAVGGRLLFGERVGPTAMLGIAVALGGAVLISGADFAVSAEAFAGDLLALAGAVSAAGYLLTGGRLRQRLSLLTYAGVVYTVCAVALLPAIWITDTPLSGFEPEAWLLFAVMALGPQIGGHTVFNFLLRDVRPTVIAVAVMGEPVLASIMAAALFGEVPEPAALVGGALVLVGIYVSIAAQSRAAAAAPVE